MTPPGGAVFLVVFEVLGILVSDINRKIQSTAADGTYQEIHGMKTRERIAEGDAQCAEKRQQLLTGISAFSQPPGFAQIGTDEAHERIRENLDDDLFQLLSVHLVCSLCLSRLMTLPGSARIAALILRSCSRTLGRSSLRRTLWEYSLKAAVIASASFALKKTR